MRLIHTTTMEIKEFTLPAAVEEVYAILSHVWDKDEQSFQDVQRIHARCAETGERPQSLFSEKILRSCQLAESHGYQWLWIDTCCIDKTSSAELSEAINSMFQYYSRSAVCYAYLRDVPTHNALVPKFNALVTTVGAEGDRPSTYVPSDSPFSESIWHTRGWTLQELVAPRHVLFLSLTWDVIGSRADLAEELEAVTRVPKSVLQLSQKASEISIMRRMSWACRRKTTRVEDEAYALLGIFNVNMPTLYGEGRRAFQRLQEEIMRTHHDTTLFAWGNCGPLTRGKFGLIDQTSERTTGILAASPSDFQATFYDYDLMVPERSSRSWVRVPICSFVS